MIREMTKLDFEAFWPCFESVIKAQESYTFDPNMSLEMAYKLWCEMPLKAFVWVDGEQVLGSYYIKPNGMGPSDHICNCGYMVDVDARGKGVARQLCEHSQQIAIELGFQAMQFNAVVSSNEIAVKLWKKLGFKIVGTIPLAYRHGKLGYVDSYVMYKWLLT
ncbi:GNAT family N-acetyltransferase [Celerinatantimonas yamalensis]|uniref:GNAT family N-acetyltransferase n=1 Tax=Celerinatantimonas yamalensis TaxID=559956 RepID=A0ABW9G2A5_9GAMM